MNISELKIGLIGSGMMGGALMEAAARKFGGKNIFVTDVDFSKAEAFAKKIGGTALETNAETASRADVLFLAVKPQFLGGVLDELRNNSALKTGALVVSIAAGVTIKTICEKIYPVHLVRVMPNLPATVGEAMIALSASEFVSDEEKEIVREILSASGKVEVVPEKLMDAVTAVSGSGPAYAFMFIEALADAAVRFGMPRSQAYIYAAQTLRGSATLFLEDGRSVSELKDAVCSPAGTTIEAVAALEKGNFRSTVIEAATAAFKKSVELGKK